MGIVFRKFLRIVCDFRATPRLQRNLLNLPHIFPFLLYSKLNLTLGSIPQNLTRSQGYIEFSVDQERDVRVLVVASLESSKKLEGRVKFLLDSIVATTRI